KIGEVQNSQGRLSSPVFPGEALSIWPAGDFRIVRGQVDGALLAVALGLIAAAWGAWVLVRRRQLALLSMLVTGGVVYVGAADFDTLDPGQLDKFDYAITTSAAFQSTAPANFEPVLRDGDYVLWKRKGQTPRSRVLDDEDGDPGATLDCGGGPPERTGTATV